MKIEKIKNAQEGFNQVIKIQNFAEKNNQKLYHLTIHPKDKCNPEHLFSQVNKFLKKKVFPDICTFNKKEFSCFLSFIEFGKQVIDLNNQEITRTGIHIHTLFTSNQEISSLKEKISNYNKWSNWEVSIELTHLKKVNNPQYWVKQIKYLSEVLSQNNFGSFKPWLIKRRNLENTWIRIKAA